MRNDTFFQGPLDDGRRRSKAEITYNWASDLFDHPALSFWNRFGQATVARAGIGPGMRVLDVCAGTGASALPAARLVGPTGRVTGVDLADNLLDLAREKASAQGLTNTTFLRADMTDLPFADGSFDVVVIVFGIFFVREMEEQVGRLWRLVKPGGRLMVTTWGPRIFEPGYTAWREVIGEVAPEWGNDFNPWDRITTEAAVWKLLEDGGVSGIRVEPEAARHPLREPEDFWRIAMGTGFRWPIMQMGAERAAVLRERLLQWLRDRRVESVETNVIYGMGFKKE
jgi:SAM-dependent methyltransferase